MFVTVYYRLLRPSGKITGVNAGHNRPLLYRTRTKTHEFLPRGGRPLGWFEDLPRQALCIYQLEPGDVLVFYTDGLTEAENIRREPYGDDRLVAGGAQHCRASGRARCSRQLPTRSRNLWVMLRRLTIRRWWSCDIPAKVQDNNT